MDCFYIFCLIFYQYIAYNPFTEAVTDIYKSPNVKTALFTELDITRSCWSLEETNLLRSRMILQDLIPTRTPRDFQYLLMYLRSTEQAAERHSPEGNVRRIMLLALTDVLGGYLQSVAIPLAKENYYAGNIDYTIMSKLYKMLNEMKHRLRTDGGTWSRPVDTSKFTIKVTPLNFPVRDPEVACKALVMVPQEKCAAGVPKVVIPYLDIDDEPGAIALPLNSRNLFSLKHAKSSHIIVRFYLLARECLAEMPHENTETFNAHFMAWLVTKVVPHLYDDVWYPGFGGVMQIVKTVNGTELINLYNRHHKSNDNNSLENSLTEKESITDYKDRVKVFAKYNTVLFIVILVTLLVVLFLPFCCCYYTHRYNLLKDKSSSSSIHALLSFYCGLKDNVNNPAGFEPRDNVALPRQQDYGSFVIPTTKVEDETSSSIQSLSEEESDSSY